jgi:hypothetical protein
VKPAWQTLVDIAQALGKPLAFSQLHEVRNVVLQRTSPGSVSAPTGGA